MKYEEMRAKIYTRTQVKKRDRKEEEEENQRSSMFLTRTGSTKLRHLHETSKTVNSYLREQTLCGQRKVRDQRALG